MKPPKDLPPIEWMDLIGMSLVDPDGVREELAVRALRALDALDAEREDEPDPA